MNNMFYLKKFIIEMQHLFNKSAAIHGVAKSQTQWTELKKKNSINAIH